MTVSPLLVSPLVKNLGAIAYTFTLYALGVLLITVQPWQWNIVGVILLVHALLLSATFTHEFIHGNIFKDRQLNAFWGQAMTHLNGGCYATWDALVEHHFNHHLHHADFVGFDFLKYFNMMNPWLRSIYVVLEWLYFPIFEFELRWRVILAPWLEADKRSLQGRAIALMLYRMTAFAVLAWISWKALLLYCVAYISFVNVMRFADAFHHTYDYAIVGQEFPKRDRLYEQEHTFSNLVSVKYPWLNLLFLNFGYHNAHHHNMSCPWHELPELHQKLYSDQGGGLLPLPQLVSNYHRFRLYRLFSGQGDATLDDNAVSSPFTGGVGVSFLTPP
ncbi:MAG: fatty acid desaturase [Oculatellaceae cyanobacterium bins.114]|nr:fatty acid desaturase [Oculatellaceae cyanobacterium bins.114]